MSLWHRCFTVNFAEFLRAPFLTEHLWWLLLLCLILISCKAAASCHINYPGCTESVFQLPETVNYQTPTETVFCEICEIFKNKFFQRNISGGCFWNTDADKDPVPHVWWRLYEKIVNFYPLTFSVKNAPSYIFIIGIYLHFRTIWNRVLLITTQSCIFITSTA